MTGTSTGTAGGSKVSVAVPRLKWQRRATLAGSVGGRPTLAEWRMVHVASRGGSDGYAAGLSGRLAGEILDVEAVLHFDPSGYLVSRALVVGEVLGQGLEARVVPGEASGGAREAFVVSGGLYVGLERVSAKHARFAVASPMPFAFYVAEIASRAASLFGATFQRGRLCRHRPCKRRWRADQHFGLLRGAN